MKQLLDGCCMPFFLLNTLQKGRIIFVGHPFVGACDERGGWQHKLKLVQDNRVFDVPLVIQPHPTSQWKASTHRRLSGPTGDFLLPCWFASANQLCGHICSEDRLKVVTVA